MKVDNKSVIKPLFRFFSRSNGWENETEMSLHISESLKSCKRAFLSGKGARFSLGFLTKA